MLIFAPAKINIGLYVNSKRKDGYHNIETVFYAIPLYDVIEVLPSDVFELCEYGFRSECQVENNLCFLAWKILNNVYGIPAVKINLLKNIPPRSGLGGGASDAVAVLKALNNIFNTGITQQEMSEYAIKLGSDCNFFINTKPSYATSKGEKCTPVNISLSGKTLLIFKPQFDISTKDAYAQIIPEPNGKLRENIFFPLHQWKYNIINVFEKMFYENFPEMKKYVVKLYNSGAVYVSMSGTGSAFYAIYDTNYTTVPEFPQQWYVKKLEIL